MTEDQKIQEQLKNRGNLPHHVAIIMDGNGRWARKRGFPRIAGHKQAIKSVRDIVEVCGQLEIDVLTLYTFSLENWQRPKNEVSALMNLLVKTIKNEVEELAQNNVKLITIGHPEDLPLQTRKSMEFGIKRTEKSEGLTLNLALSYGGRLEIVDAVKKIAEKVKAGELEPDQIDENLFSNHLYTKDLPNPDLMIRTSGESRISNFLLWQLAYTEMYITDVLWPDFRRNHLYEAIHSFQKRERRFGKVSDQL